MKIKVENPSGAYSGDVKELYEMGFAQMYDLTTGSDASLALKTGVTIDSTATAPVRRATSTVTFTTKVLVEKAQAAAQGAALTVTKGGADFSTAMTAIQAGNTKYSAVTVPSANSLAVEQPVVTQPAGGASGAGLPASPFSVAIAVAFGFVAAAKAGM